MAPLHGLIMMCSAENERQCLSSGVFGGPHSSLPQLERVTADTLLFLYNLSSRLLQGAWQTAGPPCFDPDSATFGGLFPAHLPVTRVMQCAQLPLEAVTQVLGCAGGPRFSQELSQAQVARLLALMQPAAPAHAPSTVVALATALQLADAKATVAALEHSCKAACQGASAQEPLRGKIALVKAKLAAAKSLVAMHRPGNGVLRSAAEALREAGVALEQMKALQAALASRKGAVLPAKSAPRSAAAAAAVAPQPPPVKQLPNGKAHTPPQPQGLAAPSSAAEEPPAAAPPAAAPEQAASQAEAPAADGRSAGVAPPSCSAAASTEQAEAVPPPKHKEQQRMPASMADLFSSVLEEVLTPTPKPKRRLKRRRQSDELPAAQQALPAEMRPATQQADQPSAAGDAGSVPSEVPAAPLAAAAGRASAEEQPGSGMEPPLGAMSRPDPEVAPASARHTAADKGSSAVAEELDVGGPSDSNEVDVGGPADPVAAPAPPSSSLVAPVAVAEVGLRADIAHLLQDIASLAGQGNTH
jgi:hypothetical protein